MYVADKFVLFAFFVVKVVVLAFSLLQIPYDSINRLFYMAFLLISLNIDINKSYSSSCSLKSK